MCPPGSSAPGTGVRTNGTSDNASDADGGTPAGAAADVSQDEPAADGLAVGLGVGGGILCLICIAFAAMYGMRKEEGTSKVGPDP